MEYCECGCGQVTTIYKGKPRRFARGHSRCRPASVAAADLAAYKVHWERAGIPYGLCLCGCGGSTPVSSETERARGWFRGEPRRYIRNHHQRLAPVDYVVDSQTGCWVWQLSLVRTGGYGQMREGVAHRVYYERLVGPIPEGLHLHHVCENRLCVNPDHLEPMTQLDHNRSASWVKLSLEDARAIRREYQKWTGKKRPFARQIGAKLGVSPVTVECVIAGRTWRED